MIYVVIFQWQIICGYILYIITFTGLQTYQQCLTVHVQLKIHSFKMVWILQGTENWPPKNGFLEICGGGKLASRDGLFLRTNFHRFCYQTCRLSPNGVQAEPLHSLSYLHLQPTTTSSTLVVYSSTGSTLVVYSSTYIVMLCDSQFHTQQDSYYTRFTFTSRESAVQCHVYVL